MFKVYTIVQTWCHWH